MSRQESPRSQLMREMRIAGHRLEDVAVMFGVSKQHVAKVSGKIFYDRICRYCGDVFATTTANSYFCPGKCKAKWIRSGKMPKQTAAEKILLRVAKQANGCWNWTGSRSQQTGYGTVSWEGDPIRTHRWAWMHKHGEIPDGLCVLHKCDNPACINPDHLFLGTSRENIEDRDRKGRGKGWTRLFNDRQANVIRSAYRSGMSILELAAMLECHSMTIYNLVTGKTYRSLSGRTRRTFAKLKEEDIPRIRELYASGSHTHESLGLKFDVNGTTIGRVLNKSTWADM